MSLLTPDFGLLFWMVLTFAIVCGILAKFGFPVIIKMVDERRDYIQKSLNEADEANKRLENMKQESEAILNETRANQSMLIKKTLKEGDEIIQQAKEKASIEADRQLTEATRQIEAQKQKAIHEIRSQVAMLSIDIAEKILRRELDHPETQQALISKLLDEVETEN